jgi:hypothetical protein
MENEVAADEYRDDGTKARLLKIVISSRQEPNTEAGRPKIPWVDT